MLPVFSSQIGLSMLLIGIIPSPGSVEPFSSILVICQLLTAFLLALFFEWVTQKKKNLTAPNGAKTRRTWSSLLPRRSWRIRPWVSTPVESLSSAMFHSSSSSSVFRAAGAKIPPLAFSVHSPSILANYIDHQPDDEDEKVGPALITTRMETR